jgi:hypothetical protein
VIKWCYAGRVMRKICAIWSELRPAQKKRPGSKPGLAGTRHYYVAFPAVSGCFSEAWHAEAVAPNGLLRRNFHSLVPRLVFTLV